MTVNISKYQVATAIAVIFHTIGLAGILLSRTGFFVQSTPFNLLLSFFLLLWTQKEKNYSFLLFALAVCSIGFCVELVGAQTGFLFGQYSYGSALGFKCEGVPLLIALNWFVIIYCCGISTQTLLLKVINSIAVQTKEPAMILKAMSVIVDGATLAVIFDWLMEPVAVKLGFWQWAAGGAIPLYNYICWFIISLLFLTLFHFCKFNKENKFAINLLLIQAMFFLVLRTFMQ